MQETFVLNLKRIALVGDPWERQAVREHYKDEIATLADQFEFIDLLGLPMTEIRKRVAVLPEDTVIIYTAINVDGAGVAYIPREALAAVAEVSNRPIVIDAETSVGYGGTGGLITRPHLIGQQTAQIVLRIFNGERPSEIPITVGEFVKPVFDWRQLQSFGISESRLPPGSEVRFREFSLWERYRWQMVAIFFGLLLQTALVGWLLFEHHRRRIVEMKLCARLLEVIRLNRTATAGALSASVAHELNQCVPVPGEGLKDGNRTPAKAKRILVVEDEPMIRMLLEDMLGELGYTSPPKPQASKRRWKRRRTPTSTLGSSTPISTASPALPVAQALVTRGTPFGRSTWMGQSKCCRARSGSG